MSCEPKQRHRNDPMGRVMFIGLVTFFGATAIGNVPAAFAGSVWAVVTVVGCLLVVAAAVWAHRTLFRDPARR